MTTPALAQLCDRVGIANEARGAAGVVQPVPAQTRRALLAALGIDAGGPEQAQRSLEALLDQDWRRRLPPVVAVRGDDALSLPLTRPAGDARPLHWHLTTEGGAETGGDITPAALQVVDHRVIDGREYLLHDLPLELPDTPGYHRLTLRGSDDGETLATTTLIVAPRRCHQPPWLGDGSRPWGIAARLEQLRSTRDWGIGDLTVLTGLIDLAAGAGAMAVALAPLHIHGPGTRPSGSRLFLDPLLIDVEMIEVLADCAAARSLLGDDGFQARLRALRTADRVDCGAVADIKLALFAELFEHFRRHDLAGGSPAARDFLAFRREPHPVAAETLETFALHQALAEAMGGDWPGPYRDPHAPETAAFARERTEQVTFHVWLQWLAARQLQAAARRGADLGLDGKRTPGLIRALAAGAAAGGAEVWAAPSLFIHGARIGIPPDPACPTGRVGGALAWHPLALREAGYAPLAELLRATMHGAGALRLDALLGLLRPWLVPDGAGPDDGAHLAYPADEVLAVLALESTRAGCAIVGGEVDRLPDVLVAAIEDAGVLPARVFFDARDEDDAFAAPEDLPPRCLLLAGTIERPSLGEFWRGSDLEQHRAQGLFADDTAADAALVQRSNDRARLLLALDRAHLLPAGTGTDPIGVPALTPAHIEAVHVMLARSPARLLLVQAADLAGDTRAAADDAAPEAIRRLPLPLERWREDAGLTALLGAVRNARTGAGPAAASSGAGPVHATIPRATYRLQLHAGFGFADAADLVPYLAELGVSHCYFSPYMQARPGSTHGYDVVAHDRLNPELGSDADFDRLCETLAAHDMGQILDMVPNHVGIMGGDNRWWLDVLENGRASRYADWFDIDWSPLKEELRGKVLVPVLGDYYGNVLDEGALRLVFADGGFRVEYYEHHFPIDPREYPRILAPNLPRLRERLGGENATSAEADALAAFESLVTAFGNLPLRGDPDPNAPGERQRDKELHKRRLAELCAGQADLDHYVHECVAELNRPDDTARERLHNLLEAQAYRLAYWRVASDEINYRRFFDINDLAALRMENPATFAETHRLVLALIGEGRLDGLRIDHPDGLFDPEDYFTRLQREAAAVLGGRFEPAADDSAPLPLYLVAEKILTGDELLPADWPVHGTTGYDFAAEVDGLLVDPAGAEALSRCWHDFSGRGRSLEDEVYAAKRLVMRNMLSGELNVLASELSRIAEADPHTRDFTLGALRDALMEVVACFPVYRTYISPRGVETRDRNLILKAVAEARRRSRAADLSVFAFVCDVLLIDLGDRGVARLAERALRLAMGFQQYTSPVMAKGLEDTAMYRWHRLVSLNEVGGEPERFGLSIDDWHTTMQRRRERWPHGMLAGSTHDSKRSEDLRARLHVLSELPEQWQARVERWARLNRRLRHGEWPDAATEYLLYQTITGVWPLETPAADAHETLRRRVGEYLQKAVKEAKVHTAWTNADSEYEEALAAFVDAVLDPDRNRAFLDEFLPFQQHIARLGLFNALSQTLLRLTAPGVPDIYQGNELWRFDLVDPDNRRPVDFARRRSLLTELADGVEPPPDGGGHVRFGDGRAKLRLIRAALGLRREDPDLFRDGDYRPLGVTGPHAERLCAFARMLSGRACIALAPRLLAPLTAEAPAGGMPDPFADPGWADTLIEVPAARLEDRLGGNVVEARPDPDGQGWHLPAADVLRRFPVGLLVR